MQSVVSNQEKILSLCLQKELPFVAYQQPASGDIRLLVADAVCSFYLGREDILLQNAFVLAPFDTDGEQSLCLLPRFDSSLDKLTTQQEEWLRSQSARLVQLPSFSEQNQSAAIYAATFDAHHRAIAQGRVSKTVLSRILFEKNIQQDSYPQRFLALCAAQPNSFVHLLYLPDCGLWMGASPELLLQKRGAYLETVSLAGTARTDEYAAWSEKEKTEQHIVTDYIEELLKHFSIKNTEKSNTEACSVGDIAHLRTRFRFAADGVEANAFLSALHPTPAVCGYPKAEAKEVILASEQHPRRLYAGFLGQVESDGNFSFYVNIRCMQCFANGSAIHVGGGITAQSEMQSEYLETQLKAESLLKSMQLKK